jgi:arginine utilization regulatory protein
VILDSQKLAMIDGNLLIVGETGVGKEMFAQAVHNISKNNHEMFFAINCAAVPDNLLESTLFGTSKGSFTGSSDLRGVLEEVGAGTLFLDELNAMPASMQTKLLRVLQEKKFRRVGSLENKEVNCRIICAVNEDPEKLIKQERLREDLYYRISRHCLFIPTLRERQEDIIHLANHFIERYNNDFDRTVTGLSSDLRLLFLDYFWPGNVRELDNVIENMVLQADQEETTLTLHHMPVYLKERLNRNTRSPSKTAENLPDQLRALETRMIENALNRYGWNISKAARHLGIIRQSLLYRMKKLDISKETHQWQ